VKLHDFGLWFFGWRLEEWSATVSQDPRGFTIFYDGVAIGHQYCSSSYLGFPLFQVQVLTGEGVPYILILKDKPLSGSRAEPGVQYFQFNDRLILNDFKIISNPHYKGQI
jgi:hypothetical protein